MTDSEFLNWIADRLVHVYGESENVDFVLKVRSLAASYKRMGSLEVLRSDLAKAEVEYASDDPDCIADVVRIHHGADLVELAKALAPKAPASEAGAR